jgi:cell division septal protein FtsQ
MGLNITLAIHDYLFLLCFFTGFSFLSYCLVLFFLNIAHYLKFKTLLMSNNDRYIISLVEKNKELEKQKAFLQQQIDDITTNLINNLQ